jgi:hypothetical protein
MCVSLNVLRGAASDSAKGLFGGIDVLIAIESTKIIQKPESPEMSDNRVKKSDRRSDPQHHTGCCGLVGCAESRLSGPKRMEGRIWKRV